MTPAPNPYVGPRAYEQRERELFFGRDRETNELFSLVCAHPVVLFYSQSGAGKTSLLNAGVIPRLKAQGDQVFGVARVGGKLPKETDEARLLNVFVFNALLSMQGERSQFPPERLSRMSLAEYLRSQERDEEREYFYPLHVVVFDQFEEFFTSFPGRLAHQEGFFVNVSKALEAYPLLRVVFTMREEYIAGLDPFARMLPERLKRRFRMERLRAEAALRAVEGPLEGTGRRFGPRVAKKLVNNLMQVPIKYVGGTVSTTGEYVEPVQLQIVCHNLWEALPTSVGVIDERDVSKFGDVDSALAKYYSDALKKVIETREKVDKSKTYEKGLRIWFEKSLITPVRTRGTVYMDEGHPEDNPSPPVVKLLEDLRLIRPELRGGATWYELTHDRFIEPILQSNAEWFASLSEDDQLFIQVEQKANEWEQKGRRAEDLLTDEELRRVQRAWERHAGFKERANERLKAYVGASEVAFDKRQFHAVVRRRKLALMLLGAVVLAIMAIAGFSSYKAWQAWRVRRDVQMRKADLAKEFADVKGKEYAALAFGIEAVGMSDSPSPEAVEGLRKALAVIDDKVWLREGAGAPDRLELSANGALTLTASGNEFLVWDAATGEMLPRSGRPAPENGEWRKTTFSPDGKLIYAVSAPVERDPSQSRVEQDTTGSPAVEMDARAVLVIDARSGDEKEELQARLKGARGIIVSDDGRYVLADLSGDVRIIEVATAAVSPRFPESQLQWRQIALSPDGRRVAAVYADSAVDIFASDSGKPVGTFNAGVRRGQGRDFIAFSPDGHRVALARPSSDGETVVAVWDDSAGQRAASFRVKVGAAKHAAFSPDGNSVVVLGDARAAVYRLDTGKAVERPLPQGGVAQYFGVNALFIHNGDGKSTVFKWDALTGETKVLAEADSAKYKFTRAAVTPDARRVITASEDNIIQVWAVGAPPDVTHMTPDELMANACAKLRDSKRGYEQVSDLCEDYPQGQ
jgi:DNA-binding beta-propeller fold protein YncE